MTASPAERDAGPVLRIDELSMRYATGDQALTEVSFDLPAGEVLMVIGSSGAGKSTLIKCVNRLLDPTGGRVWLSGEDMAHLGGKRLRHARRRIGMIFQDHALIDRLTVMENVLCGRLGYTPAWRSLLGRFAKADIQRAYQLLDRVGLSDHVNKRADALSGGQRQRVGIARALIQSDQLLLVDEPTASLDPSTARQIMRLITDLARESGLAALVNIHDVPLAKSFGDRVIGLHRGRLVFDAPPDQLDAAAMTRIYGSDAWSDDAADSLAPEQSINSTTAAAL